MELCLASLSLVGQNAQQKTNLLWRMLKAQKSKSKSSGQIFDESNNATHQATSE
jgi:hypothetical protein